MLCVLYVTYDPGCLPAINILKASIYNDIQYFLYFVKAIKTIGPARNSSFFFKKRAD